MPLRSPLVSAAAPWNFLSRRKRSPRAFTLIELLIVVAIIAILAAIAAPNYLEAQMRAKVSRVESDLRTMTTGLESFRIDFNTYPEGTDDASRMPAPVVQELDALAPGYYTFASLGPNGEPAGGGFPTLTTPVAYLSNAFIDPFAGTKNPFLTYCYRNAKDRKNGYIITSFGPDADLLSQEGGGPGKGTLNDNPLGTFRDTKNPSRCGDINERDVIHYMEGTSASVADAVNVRFGNLRAALVDLAYDPTNGSVSDGDLYRLGP